jgi:hypothetical protein
MSADNTVLWIICVCLPAGVFPAEPGVPGVPVAPAPGAAAGRHD